MKKDLYHGSPQILKKPIFGFGKIENDYGCGFYCTEIEDMAKEWSTGEDHARKKRAAGQLYITEILDKTIGPKDERLLRALS